LIGRFDGGNQLVDDGGHVLGQFDIVEEGLGGEWSWGAVGGRRGGERVRKVRRWRQVV
jgi:hypothetical protein